MQTISAIEELKKAIRLAEDKHSINGKLLKEQFLIIFETNKPGNLLLSTIREVTSGPNLVKLVAGTALGLTTGYLSKKLVAGTSAIILRKILGAILQFNAARVFSKNVNFVDFHGKSIPRHLVKKNIS